jgi:hypothetical protein
MGGRQQVMASRTTSRDVHRAASLFNSAVSNSELLIIVMNNDL